MFIQPRLTMDLPDFVAVHPRYGVCAIEVKDWNPGRYRNLDGVVQRRQDSQWVDIDPGAILIAGSGRFWSVVRIEQVDDDGQVHSSPGRCRLTIPRHASCSKHASRAQPDHPWRRADQCALRSGRRNTPRTDRSGPASLRLRQWVQRERYTRERWSIRSTTTTRRASSIS